MRKILFLIVGLSLLVGISSCNKNNGQSAEKPTEQTQEDKTPKNLQHLTKTEFLTKVTNYEQTKEWKYLGDKPCIVDFYADWCPPCKQIAPILEELAKEYENDIYIYKVNVDKEGELASHFGIQSIPTLFFIPLNEKPQVTQGALSKEELKKAIERVLLKKK